MKILIGMPSKDSWGGPAACEPPFVDALRTAGNEVREEVYVYGDKGKPIPVHRRVCRVLSTALRFRRILSKQKFDLIHLNTAFDLRTILRDSFSIFLMAAGQAKIFLKIHGSETVRFERTNFLVLFLINYLSRRVDAFGIFTHEEKAAFIRLGIPSEKLYFVKNAITLTRESGRDLSRPAKSPHGTMRLLFVSRFLPAKGLIETIQVCGILRDNGYNFSLNCVGDGESRIEAENLSKTLNLTDRIQFTGYIAEERVTEYFIDSDILVFPTSHDEGFPIVLFKAVAAGLSVVTTKIRAAADYLSEPENCLFCTKDPHDIALKLERLFTDLDVRAAMKKNNLEFARSLDPDSIAKEFLNIYREVLDK